MIAANLFYTTKFKQFVIKQETCILTLLNHVEILNLFR